MEYKEVKTGFDDESRVQWDQPGKVVEGVLAEVLTLKSQLGQNFKKYVVKSGDVNHSFLGCYQLDRALPGLPIGTQVRVTYKGLEKIKGGKTMKSFSVMVGEAQSPSVA